jgi:hypothetical protein
MLSITAPIGGSNKINRHIENVQNSILYYHYGNFIFQNTSLPNTFTSYDLWITKELISNNENSKSYIYYKYKYKLIGVSKSTYYGGVRNTFMEGFQIFYNNSAEPMNNYPLNLYIQKNPTVLYEIKSNDETPSFYVSWTNSYYDARQ